MKTALVTKFLKDMVELAIPFTVDDENYVIWSADRPERLLLSDDGKLNSNGQPILLYQEEIKDHTAYILNPLAEGLGQTPSSSWFYRLLQASLSARIQGLCRNIIHSAIAAKKTTDKEESHLPIEILNVAAKISDDVDDKTLGELELIFDSPESHEFLVLYYQKKNIRYVVRSAIFEHEGDVVPGIASFRSKFNTDGGVPKIRKKSWGVFEKLLLGILHIKTDEELHKFGRKSTGYQDGVTCVRLSSMLNTLLAIFEEINPLLSHINNGELAIDLSMLTGHIDNLGGYAINARGMVQSRQTTPPPQNNLIPGTANIPGAAPSAMYGNVGQQQQPIIPGGDIAIPGYNVPANSVILAPNAAQQGNMPGPYYNPPQQQQQPGPGFGQQPNCGYGQQQPQYGYGQQPQMGQWPQQGQPGYQPLPWENIPPPPQQWGGLMGNQQNMQGMNFVPGMPQGIYR